MNPDTLLGDTRPPLQSRFIRFFLLSAGVILLISAAAKAISALGHSGMLEIRDPLLMFSFRTVFWIATGMELATALICFFGKRQAFQIGVLALLTTAISTYRVGLFLIGYTKPCHCLGDLTEALHLSASSADILMQIILLYLLVGSFTSWVLTHRMRNGNPARVTQ